MPRTPAPLSLHQERQAVLDALALPLLFLGSARVELTPADTDAVRVVSADILAGAPLTAAGSAALLCTVLHDARVSAVSIVREGASVRAQCTYQLPFATWRIDLRTLPIDPVRIDLSERRSGALASLDPDRIPMPPLAPLRAPFDAPAADIEQVGR